MYQERGVLRNRQNLSTSHGLKLLALIQLSISLHLELRHGIERYDKRIHPVSTR